MKITQIKKIGNILYGLVFGFLFLIAGLLALSTLNIPGNIKLLVVESGSMEPKIKTGSVVVVKPENSYKEGDVITVYDSANHKVSVTHRIFRVLVENEKVVYITKGDANNSADMEARHEEAVVGKVVFSVPFVGYPINFAKTRNGLVLLIIIPAAIIVYSEIITIKNEFQKLIKERKRRRFSTLEMKTDSWYKKNLRKIIILLLTFWLGFFAVGITKAFLSNTEATSVSITAGTWDDPTPAASPEATAEETPTPEPTITPESTPTATPTETPTASPEATATPEETPTPTPEPTP